MSGGRLLLTPDYTRVPANVKEYAGTLGVKLELGEAYADRAVDTSGMFYHEANGGHYIGLPGPTAVELADATRIAERIRVVRSNGPVAFEVRDGALELRLDARGMQEIELYSPVPLKVSGKGLRVAREGHYYTVIHYGERAQFTIKA